MIGFIDAPSENFIWDVIAPEPVLLEDPSHLFDEDVLCLGHEEGHKDGRQDHEGGEQEEDPEFHAAEHAEEDLHDDEGDRVVAKHVNGLTGWSDLERADLARYQPRERAPRPCKGRYVGAN